jgi:acyl-CoA thioester hydrolase
MCRTPPGRRADYRYFQAVTTRWKDNDFFGHVNNVEYLSYFDTGVTVFEMKHAGIDLFRGPTRIVMADVSCRYHSSVAFPDALTVGLRVAHIGNTSYSYDLAVFRENCDIASAEGRFVRVLVDDPTQRPVPIPSILRTNLLAFTTNQ